MTKTVTLTQQLKSDLIAALELEAIQSESETPAAEVDFVYEGIECCAVWEESGIYILSTSDFDLEPCEDFEALEESYQEVIDEAREDSRLATIDYMQIMNDSRKW
jgi:hypothetical protein